jgi:adenylate kinase
MIIAVLTGMSGSERRDMVAGLVPYAQQHGYGVTCIDLWEEMQAVDPNAAEATILNIADAHRARIVQEAFRRVEAQIVRLEQNHSGDDWAVIVVTHATFFWNSSYLEAFPDKLLSSLHPEVLFTVEPNVLDAFHNLRSDSHRRFDQISISDILYWRDRETEETVRWARGLRIPHFLVSRNEPEEILSHLLFQRHRKRIYASYPMSHVTEEERNASQGLIQGLRRKGYVVFDPGALEDLGQINSLLEQRRIGQGILSQFSDSEVMHLLRAAGDHTVKRDYQLIDQSDLVVVYYPSIPLFGSPSSSEFSSAGPYIPLSAGVICEMVHGHTAGKRVYAVWLPETEPSPFFTYHAHRIARSSQELLEMVTQLDPP